VLGVLAFLPVAGQGGSFYGFLATFMLLFAATGIGNGSTFRMIPVVIMDQHLHAVAARDLHAQEQAARDANTESAAVLGFASAVGAFGGFFIPMSYGISISLSGAAHVALALFLFFYLVCIATTWWYYARRGAPMPC
jgi:NNP family nitrate/nitrite transporter-like MFS transporter